MTTGFEVLNQFIIDTHFSERERLGRLLAAIEKHPKKIGIGIDEGTFLVLKDDTATVHGKGNVYIIAPEHEACLLPPEKFDVKENGFVVFKFATGDEIPLGRPAVKPKQPPISVPLR